MLARRPRRSLLPLNLQSVVLLASEGEVVTANPSVEIGLLSHVGRELEELAHAGPVVRSLIHAGPEVEV